MIQNEGLTEFTDFNNSSEEALGRAMKTITEAPQDCDRPIPLMLLDFQMPRMNGDVLVQKLQEFIKEQNEERIFQIKDPVFVLVTAYNNLHFR